MDEPCWRRWRRAQACRELALHRRNPFPLGGHHPSEFERVLLQANDLRRHVQDLLELHRQGVEATQALTDPAAERGEFSVLNEREQRHPRNRPEELHGKLGHHSERFRQLETEPRRQRVHTRQDVPGALELCAAGDACPDHSRSRGRRPVTPGEIVAEHALARGLVAHHAGRHRLQARARCMRGERGLQDRDHRGPVDRHRQ